MVRTTDPPRHYHPPLFAITGLMRDNTPDNIHCVQPVQSVHGTPQVGRSGRSWKHLPAPPKVEGLVDFMVRGGSSPLGRTGKAPLDGAFLCLASEVAPHHGLIAVPKRLISPMSSPVD
jgi:hypothetical protein